MKKLNVKAWELLISNGSTKCEKCGRTVPSGTPALVHRFIDTVEGELILREQTECVHLCGDCPRIVETLPTLDVQPQKSRLPMVRREWESLPDIALPEHRASFPIFNLNGEKVATGYASILAVTDSLMFLECEEPQVVVTMFKEARGESDRYGEWVQMRTPSGFFGRKYLKRSGRFVAGMWYFRLNLLRPGLVETRIA